MIKRLGFCLFGLSLCAPAFAQTPAAVVEGLNKKWPQAQNVAFEKEARDYWEAEFTQDGQELEAHFLSDGTLLAVSQEVALDQAPEALKRAMGGKMSYVKELERFELAGGPTLWKMEFEGNRERWFNPEGRPVKPPFPQQRARRIEAK